MAKEILAVWAAFRNGTRRPVPYVWVWSVLIIGFVLFSLAPAFYELLRSTQLHDTRQFELVHNFPTDYNFYLSRIRQGLEGRVTVIEKYTAEQHSGSLIHEMYLIMGQVARFARVPIHRAGDVYHMARIVLAGVLLVAIAAFCRRMMGMRTGYALIAFLLSVTASSWPKLVAVVDNHVVPAVAGNVSAWRFGGYMAWWSVMDSLQRITFIPHLLAGQALIVVLILLLTRPELYRKGANVVFVGLLLFLLGMIFPPGLVFVYGTVGIWWLLSGKKMWRFVTPYAVMAFMGASSLLYLVLMTGIYPWKRLVEVDIIRPLPFDYLEYVKALGPILPFGGIGLVLVLLKWEVVMFPAVAWVLAWGALLGVFAFIPQQSPLRFSEMIPHVPLGVLTAYALVTFGRRARHVVGIVAVLLIATGVFHMYSSFLWQRDFVDHKIRATLPLVPTGSFVMYPLKDFIDGMWYLYDATRGKGVVLSETAAGNYIPVISGNSVYAGHDNTVAFEAKKERVKEFFAGRMDAPHAETWVKETGASYVFFGPQEREDGGLRDLTPLYPFLTQVYKNTYVTVYRVAL